MQQQDVQKKKRKQDGQKTKRKQDGQKKKRKSGKSRSSTPWDKGVRKGRSWVVDWNTLGKKPQLARGVRYDMVWLGGRNLKLVKATKVLHVPIKQEKSN